MSLKSDQAQTSEQHGVRSRTMTRVRRAAAVLTLAGAGAFGLASATCVDAEAKFYIVTPVAHGTKDNVCETSPTCSFVSAGVGPTAVGDQIACFLVTNGLIPRGQDDANRPEVDRIILSEVDIQVLDGSGAVIDSFSRATNGFLEPTHPSAPMPVSVSFPILRTESVQNVKAGDVLTVGVILKGRTTGGVNIQTPEYYISVESGAGCGASSASCC